MNDELEALSRRMAKEAYDIIYAGEEPSEREVRWKWVIIGLRDIVDDRAALRKDLAEMTKQRDQWKANHDNQVEIKRAVLDRPDLKERASSVVALVAERDLLRERLAKYEKPLEKDTPTEHDWELLPIYIGGSPLQPVWRCKLCKATSNNAFLMSIHKICPALDKANNTAQSGA